MINDANLYAHVDNEAANYEIRLSRNTKWELQEVL